MEFFIVRGWMVMVKLLILLSFSFFSRRMELIVFKV